MFGDCGAFSYVNEEYPTITVDQAAALYESYGFDFGASVDHIPVKAIKKNGRPIELTDDERQARVNLTLENARLFIEAARKRKAQFNPVGHHPSARSGAIRSMRPVTITPSGIRHLAIGGLVPQRDDAIESIVTAVVKAADDLKERPWIHLFGIFRPNLQRRFRELKVDSFDSASYFRKAWLRSDQNYLGTNGHWYAALRVPMTGDGRTRSRLAKIGADIQQLEKEERNVLDLLCKFDRDEVGINEVLDAVVAYDRHLARSSETQSMRAKYRQTLEEQPWRNCDCSFCRSLGIHMLIFRGANRNKRRGAHNTLMLYGSITEGVSV